MAGRVRRISRDEAAERLARRDRMETLGAFVELDTSRLDKRGMFLLGCKEFLTKYRAGFEHVARTHPNPIMGNIIMQVIAPMVEEEERVTLELTRLARRLGAVTIHELRHDKDRS